MPPWPRSISLTMDLDHRVQSIWGRRTTSSRGSPVIFFISFALAKKLCEIVGGTRGGRAQARSVQDRSGRGEGLRALGSGPGAWDPEPGARARDNTRTRTRCTQDPFLAHEASPERTESSSGRSARGDRSVACPRPGSCRPCGRRCSGCRGVPARHRHMGRGFPQAQYRSAVARALPRVA